MGKTPDESSIHPQQRREQTPLASSLSVRAILAAAWAVLIKDLRSELRTRYALNALVLFAVSAAVAVSLGIGFIGLRRSDEALFIQSTLLWIALLFAALNGLSRSFVHEEETGTMAALRLAAPPIAVFLGKFFFNLALLALLDLVTTLLFIVLVRVEIGSPLAFTLMLVSGGLCLASATTMLAAIIAKASFKLEVAKTNLNSHGLAQRITLLQGDLFTPLDTAVDLIVSNPPYTILSEIDANVREYEPWLALDGGEQGLEIYQRLLENAPTYLRPDGAILLEIGSWQGDAVANMAARSFANAHIRVLPDLTGRDRVVQIRTGLF